MIGLPLPEAEISEEEAIVAFMLKIQQATRIQCTVNVGTFIPKPHTPYQWARQISMEESKRKLDFIRFSLPKGKFRVSTHNEFVSFIEGMISRGDERVGDALLSAYKKAADSMLGTITLIKLHGKKFSMNSTGMSTKRFLEAIALKKNFLGMI